MEPIPTNSTNATDSSINALNSQLEHPAGNNQDYLRARDAILERIPMALTATYRTAAPNTSIELYRGLAQVKYSNDTIECDVVISFDWLPVPATRFRLTKFPFKNFDQEREVTIQLKDKPFTCVGRVTSLEMFGGNPPPEWAKIVKSSPFPATGYIDEQVPTSACNPHAVNFHLTNFIEFLGTVIRDDAPASWTGRELLEVNGWKITIDQIRLSKAQRDAIEDSGGFGITSVGCLERIGGGSFSKDDADELLACLGQFLSFVAGRWVAPILREYRGIDGANCMEDWLPYRTSRHATRQTWFNSVGRDVMQQSFSGFVKHFTGVNWKEPFRLAIYWYLESNACSGGLESSVILAQAALELIAYEVLVNDAKVLSKDGFDKLPAADVIRLLLAHCHIPRDIPTQFNDLTAIAKAYNLMDGPAAVTEIRNALVHSDAKKRAKYFATPSNAKLDAWQLGLWFLDMLILHLIDYRGEYLDRRVRRGHHAQAAKKVPWAFS
jgi:hypothetical protein